MTKQSLSPYLGCSILATTWDPTQPLFEGPPKASLDPELASPERQKQLFGASKDVMNVTKTIILYALEMPCTLYSIVRPILIIVDKPCLYNLGCDCFSRP